ncbi:SWPV1-273 [Shearwaterpox virus]|uniref:SWPV1-273 n=1 Tax=Shearwaterpox virus TaxID=1974596 RepID=A0A1V0S877_CNPV|nr:SWPV1-273 [Shearwaterpox virus]
MNLSEEDVYPPLFSAVDSRNVVQITLLLEKGEDPNGLTKSKLTPIHSISSIISFSELCNLMIIYEDTIILDNYIKTFYKYNETRNLKIAKLLLNHGALVNVHNNNGITPLHIAAGSGSIKMVTLLLENGADINALTKYGESALHYAVSVKDINMCKFLLDHGIDVNIKNKKNVTALHISIEVDCYNIMRLLLRYGANPNIVSFYLLGIKKIEECKDDRLKKYLREKNVLNANNENILQDYISSSHFDFRRFSSRSKLIMRSYFEQCISPLVYLSKKGCVDEVELLLYYKADPNIKTIYQKSPLDYSILENKFDITKLLICYDADVNSMDLFKNTPIHYACKIKDDSFINILIENNADVKAKNKDGKTPLHVACKHNNISVIKRLLSKDVPINLLDNFNTSPLQYAVKSDSFDNVKFLLLHGADPNLCIDSKSSPIVMAINNNNKDIIELLIKFGADIKFINESCILHELAKVENKKMLKMLTSISGIDFSRVDDEGVPLICRLSKLSKTSIFENILLEKFVDLYKVVSVSANIFTMILDEYESMSNKIIKIILSHAAVQLQSRNNSNNLDIVVSYIESNEYFREIYKKCNEEIAKMNKIKLSKNHTLLDVYKRKLSINYLAKHHPLFSRINIREHFPMYGRYLERYLNASIKRYKILESAVISLDEIVTIDDLHYWNELSFDIKLSIVESIESKDLIDIITPDTIGKISLENIFTKT